MEGITTGRKRQKAMDNWEWSSLELSGGNLVVFQGEHSWSYPVNIYALYGINNWAERLKSISACFWFLRFIFFYFCSCISVFVCVNTSYVCVGVHCGLPSLCVGTEFKSPGRTADILNPWVISLVHFLFYNCHKVIIHGATAWDDRGLNLQWQMCSKKSLAL